MLLIVGETILKYPRKAWKWWRDNLSVSLERSAKQQWFGRIWECRKSSSTDCLKENCCAGLICFESATSASALRGLDATSLTIRRDVEYKGTYVAADELWHGIPRDNPARYYKTVVTRGDHPLRIKSNVAFERWRADRYPRGAAILGRLSCLSVGGNLCPLEDHLRTTLAIGATIVAWRGVAWRGIAVWHDPLSRVSNLYFMPILPADAPGFQTENPSIYLGRLLLSTRIEMTMEQRARHSLTRVYSFPHWFVALYPAYIIVSISVFLPLEITVIARLNDLINPRRASGFKLPWLNVTYIVVGCIMGSSVIEKLYLREDVFLSKQHTRNTIRVRVKYMHEHRLDYRHVAQLCVQ